MAKHGQGERGDNGLLRFYAYGTNPNLPVFTFPEGQGYQLVCSALYVQTTDTGSADRGDGPYQDKERHNWETRWSPGPTKRS